ncbi:hypothetical protein JYG23_04455 [Sedimentibacter sp. zth1]|uniref:hypothetical protein n=1 Tax=Sedimentibacter sp. zth1 TaxID=2816908 RepID=UPI001A92A360|nr:hypothetical protein [Sedimentibacter sp. zth1]QSX06710.1 hypothetical protein JYG23_04455 [Sedimentibacter sp. zth1]
MKQTALLTGVSEIIEEEVELRIGDVEFTGFASIIPYQLEVGNHYDVLVGITILDDFKIAESVAVIKGLKPLNSSFKYLIRGILKEGGILDAGVVFQDEIFEEYEYLINKFVEVEVDRISVEFM